MNEHEALGLGSIDADQDEDDLPPELEEAIKKGGELSEDVIVMDEGDEVV